MNDFMMHWFSGQPVRLTLSMRDPAARVLARAFQDDPLMKFTMPDEASRAEVLPWLFGTVVHYCIRYGEAFVTPGLEGVACWLPPGLTSLTMRGIFQSGMWAMGIKLGAAAIRRFRANLSYTAKMHHEVMPENHWYLWAVGVEPDRQGKGIGSRLIAPVLERASAGGFPCYLETHNEKNLGFYEKHGFEVAREGTIPMQGPQVWAMVRQLES